MVGLTTIIDVFMATSDSFSLFLNQIASDWQNFNGNVKGILALIGAWYTLRLIVRVGTNTIQLLRDSVLLWKRQNFVKKYGSWAIVTGCTAGIGNAFVNELASRGLNIILISRNEAALEEKSQYVERHYGVHTVTIVHDFQSTSIDENAMAVITEIIDSLEVGILINNVGIHYDYPMEFVELSEERMHALIQVNITSAVKMTKAVLPQMVKRKKGLIVNMSSAAGNMPFQLISLYSATKNFLNHFSQCLSDEMRPHNIHVQSLVPYYINTDMVAYSKSLQFSKIFTPCPETYAQSAVRTFGYYNVNTGYFPHTLQVWVQSLFPRFLVLRVCGWIHRRLNKQGKIYFSKRK